MKKTLFVLGAFLLPLTAFAQYDSVGHAIDSIGSILNKLVPLFIAIAVVIFLYGVLKYILAGGNEEVRAEARSMIIYGIISIFVMVAVWGFVRILVGTFFPNNNTLPIKGPTAFPNKYGTQ